MRNLGGTMRTTVTLCLGLISATTACGSASKNDGKVASGGTAAKGGAAAKGSDAVPAAIRAPRVAEGSLRMIAALRYVRIAADGALTLGEIPQAAFKDGLLDPARLGPGKATTRATLAADLAVLAGEIDAKMRAPGTLDDPPPPPEPEPPDDEPPPTTGTTVTLDEGRMGRPFEDAAAAYYATGPDDVIARPLPPERDPSLTAPLIIADPDRPARELVDVIRACESYASLGVTADGTHLRAFATRIEPAGLGVGGLGPMDAHPALVVQGAAAQIAIDAYDGKTAAPARFTWRGAPGDVAATLARAVAAPELQTHHDMRLWFDDTYTVGAMIATMEAMFAAGASPVVIGDPAGIVVADPQGTIGTGGYAVGDGTRFDRGGAPAAVPRVTIGKATISGDATAVQRSLERNRAKLAYCYERSLLADPALHGTVTLRFTVAPDGTVGDATGDGVASEVATCMRDVVAGIAFPRRARPAQVVLAIDTAPTGG